MDSALPPVTAVLVLYGMAPEQSATFRSLADLFQADPALASGFTLLLYDNSPEPHGLPASPMAVLYRHDAANGGVAAAYNAGLATAKANGSPWLLLLDQDTVLPYGYLNELRALTASVPPEVAAIIPRLQQDGHTHSPQRLPRLRHHPLPGHVTGLLEETITAYNSGAAIRTAAIERFPSRFWLDFLDHAVFHTLQANGGHIWLMEATLAHRLSSYQLDADSSTGRYLNQLCAERDFYREYGSPTDRLYYHLRRVRQTVGHLLKVRNKRFALLSAKAALGLLPKTPMRNMPASQTKANSLTS